MLMNWTDYPKQLSAVVKKMAGYAPNAVSGFVALDKGSNNTAKLDAKTRELIAIAVAVTTRCDGCIATHVGHAVKAGATREEVSEAMGVAIALNAGAALVYSARALDAYDAHAG
jgi:AhpD family alkylhydroperoxidase